MKIKFVPAKSMERLNKDFLLDSASLPKSLAIAYSIQYESLAKEIKALLKKTHTITKFSQVLGCSKFIPPKGTSAILLIGSGRFHAISLALGSNLPIYTHEQGKLYKIQEKDIEIAKQHKKAAYVKFLSSTKVGVLISTKPGQQNLSRALKLRKKFQKKDVYFFIGDFLSAAEFENFGLNSWINTACPRLDMDNSSIINITDLE